MRRISRSRYYPWIVVGLLWMVALLNYLDRQMLATMRPAMEGDISELQSAANFGYLMSIFLWIYAWMSPLSGVIADRLNRKWIIVGSLLVWSAVTLAMGYASSFRELYILRALMGVSEALYIPAGLSLLADYHLSATRSFAIGIHMTGIYAGQAFGGFGAAFAQQYSWQQTFFLVGMAGILWALVLLLLLKDRRNEPLPAAASDNQSLRGLSRSWKQLLRKGAFWVILFCFTVPSLPGWATKNWLPTLFSDHLHISMVSAGPMATITMSGSSLLGVLLGGAVSDRWVRAHLRGRVFTSAAGLALMIPSLFLMAYGHSQFSVLSAGVCFGLGFGIFDANNMPLLCQFLPARLRATGYGLMNMAGVMAGAFITEWMGRITDAGRLGQGFALLSFVLLLALGAQLIFLRPRTRDFVLNQEEENNRVA